MTKGMKSSFRKLAKSYARRSQDLDDLYNWDKEPFCEHLQDDGSFTDSKKKKERVFSNREKCLLGVLLALLVLLIAAVAYLLYMLLQNMNKPKGFFCLEPHCVEESDMVLGKMDLTVEPCKDFYHFSCGKWLQDLIVSPGVAKYGILQRIAGRNYGILQREIATPGHIFKGQNSTAIAKAKMIYQSCLDEVAIEDKGGKPLLKVIESIGSWNISMDPAGGKFDPDKWDLTETLINAHKLGPNSLFGFGIGADDKDSKTNILQFVQAGLSLKHGQMYTSKKTAAKVKTGWLNYVVKLAVLLGANEADARQQLEDVWEFETRLAEIDEKVPSRRDIFGRYNKWPLKNLTAIMPSIDVNKYLTDMLLGQKISPDTKVLVYDPLYLMEMSKIVANTSKEVLANYIINQINQKFAPYLSLKFRIASLELEKVVQGTRSTPSRSIYCTAVTNKRAGWAMGAMFADKAFGKDHFDKANEIMDGIKEQMRLTLEEADWMDNQTKTMALEKLSALRRMIGYPDFIKDPAKLDKYYEKMVVTEGDFVSNMLLVQKFDLDRIIGRYGKPVDRSEWSMKPAKVNAYYSATKNLMAFPSGILQAPLYGPNFPMALNFGSMGAIMGHELSHGFDDHGKTYDKDGNLRNWWTEESLKNFRQKSQCLRKQYSEFTVYGEHVDGDNTIGENIADNGGVRLAYRAYEKWLVSHRDTILPGLNKTSQQLFFLGWAQTWCTYYKEEYAKHLLYSDVHSPSKYRVNGPFANFPEFAEAYTCPLGTHMNPKKKCVVWGKSNPSGEHEDSSQKKQAKRGGFLDWLVMDAYDKDKTEDQLEMDTDDTEYLFHVPV
ncbi:PREDICTED: endothelin-converting enzyme 1-like isoform X2 [Branchiostoma belcheri]|uniref:Endothelin-converting enzyme 1-like isoform X2 n=1 Tax=Branchiostoma belcheri TaxID=7741 RepID=A0A6P4YMG3_BRABE|nr:PREDICTED: endothelin-converting enzyme 1-like isoform X2 [Branchiostoma belcheri]